MEWGWAGLDPLFGAGTKFGLFPLTPSEQQSHIKEVIQREAPGSDDARFKEALAAMRSAHPTLHWDNFDDDDAGDHHVDTGCPKWL